MERLIYTNPLGKSVELSVRTNYIMKNIDGTGAVEMDIQSTSSYNQDGENYGGNSLKPRFIDVELAVIANGREDMAKKRQELIKVLNPKLGLGKIEYEYGGVRRRIEGLPEKSPSFVPGNRGKDYIQETLIVFYCPDPYWQGTKTNSKEIVSWVGGLTFPLELPTEFSTKGEEQINVINNGDVETPVVIDIKGKATNPCIRNLTTGEYIKVNRDMVEEDSLRITTEFGNKRAEQNGENVFNFIDLNSTFFSLKIGDNIIQMITDDVQDEASVQISYKNRYLGV